MSIDLQGLAEAVAELGELRDIIDGRGDRIETVELHVSGETIYTADIGNLAAQLWVAIEHLRHLEGFVRVQQALREVRP